MRHRAEDRQPQIARHLLRIAHLGIRAVEDDRADDAEPETDDESHKEEPGRGILERTLGNDRRIGNAHIRKGGFRSEPRLIETLRQSRGGLLFKLGIATWPRL